MRADQGNAASRASSNAHDEETGPLVDVGAGAVPLLGGGGMPNPSLLDDLYAGATEPARLQRFLARLRAGTGSDAVGWGASNRDLADEPELRRLRSQWPPPGRFRAAKIEAQGVPAGDHRQPHHVAVVWFDEFSETVPFVSLRRAAQSGAFLDAELYRLQLFVSHLRNVMRVHQARAEQAAGASAALQMIEAAGVGVMLCGADGGVAWTNEVAEEVLRLNGLRTPTGVALTDRSQTRLLHAALARVIEGGAPSQRFFREAKPRGGEVQLAVGARVRPGMLSETALATVVVVDPARRALDTQAARTLWGLTSSEARVACWLARGMAPGAIAEAGAVSMETVRSQLKAAYAKTGTRRQPELVGLLLRGLPALGLSSLETAGDSDVLLPVAGAR